MRQRHVRRILGVMHCATVIALLRTARAGRAGLAVTYVTQYDVEQYQKIEAHIGEWYGRIDGCGSNRLILVLCENNS